MLHKVVVTCQTEFENIPSIECVHTLPRLDINPWRKLWPEYSSGSGPDYVLFLRITYIYSAAKDDAMGSVGVESDIKSIAKRTRM